MKASQINQYGSDDMISITEVDTPTITDDQVLVEVHASSINPFDVKVREGYLKDQLQLPVTLGGDVAGVVLRAGANVKHVAVGDRVYGQANAAAGNTGAFAEFAATKGNEVAVMPKNLDYKAAAAASLAGVSALQALVNGANLQAGQKILIHGGAGGIGTMAIQIAKHLGAYVAATTSNEGLEHARRLGADEVIDYRKQQFDVMLKDYDVVLDSVGGEIYRRSFTVLKKGGVIVSMLEQPDHERMDKYGVKAVAVQTRVSAESLNMLTKLIEQGAITVHVAKTFPLDRIREAFQAFEAGHISGKIAITVRE